MSENVSAKALFDAIRVLKGSALTQPEVDRVNCVLGDNEKLFAAIRAIKGKPLVQSEVDKINNILAPAVFAQRVLLKPDAFFASVRASLFHGKLSQPQVEGMNTKLGVFGRAGWPTSWAAYALATSYHETNASMQPVREGYYLGEPKAERYRKTLRYYPWYGRGDVGLTWEENYEHADKALDLQGALLANPDKALDPPISAAIMQRGMAEGWFARDKLGRHTLKRHLPAEIATESEFMSARRIINGVDKKELVASEAISFQTALLAGQWAIVPGT